MRKILCLTLLMAGACFAQDAAQFKPAESNVWGAEYPRVDSTGRVQVRIKAPDANKVKLNFWSGPKVDMEKQADGFLTLTTHRWCRLALLRDQRRWRGSQRPRQHGLFRRVALRERGRDSGARFDLLLHPERAAGPGA